MISLSHAVNAIDCTDAGSDGIANKIITVCRDNSCNCVADGTDDHVQIQEALDNAVSGDTVRLITPTTYWVAGDGTPDVNILLMGTSGVTFEGVPGSQIKLKDGQLNGMNILTVQYADNVVLRNLNIDSNMWNQQSMTPACRANPSGPCVGWNDPPNGKSMTLTVRGNNIQMEDITVMHTEGDGIELSGNNYTVRNIIAGDVRHDTIILYGVTKSTFENIRIEHNRSHGPNSGIRFYTAHDLIFDNVDFVLNPGDGSGGTYVIAMGFEFYPTQNLYQQYNITIKNSDIRYSQWGLYFNGGSQSTAGYKNDIRIRNARFSDNDDAIYILDGWNNIALDGVTIARNNNGINDVGSASSGLTVKNSIIANNAGYGIYSGSATLGLTYNDVWNNSGGNYLDSGKAGVGSISVDPLFASGTDFHLKSQYGRWDGAAWVTTDTDVSPAIDAGDPASSYANEPVPNGGRVNMGAYGNTPEASKNGTVHPLPFDFTISGSGTITVYQGNSGSNTITSTLTSAPTQSVTFSASGLPSGATYTFSGGNTCSPSCTKTFSISTRSSTPTGTYPIRVSAANGALTRTTLFNLIVSAPSQNPDSSKTGFYDCDKKQDIVFLIDESGTMINHDCIPGTPKIECVREGIKMIINSSLLEGSRIGIFTFGDYSIKRLDFTPVSGNEEYLRNFIDTIDADPGAITNIGRGIKTSLDYLEGNIMPGNKGMLLLLTDGLINPPSDETELNTKRKITDYIADNWKYGPFEIYSVGFGNSSTLDEQMLINISDNTNGKYYHVDDKCDSACLRDRFNAAIRNAREGYDVSYSFTNCDGRISKTIKFDSCATNITEYPPAARRITDIQVRDSFDDALGYVAGSAVIIYLNSTHRDIHNANPAETQSNGQKTLTYDIEDITDNKTVIIKFDLSGTPADYETSTGTNDTATTQFKIADMPYTFEDSVKFRLYCDCSLNPQCDGNMIEDNADCIQDDHICMRDATGIRRYGERDILGRCAAIPGCYCIEDPWIWVADASYSRDVCECIAGDGMWEPAISKCCSAQECFISDDRAWICDKGTKKDGSQLCEQLSACGKEWYWNNTFWADKMTDGCDCETSETCGSGMCLEGRCQTLEEPGISFTQDTTVLELGSKTELVIHVKNNLAVKDTITIRADAFPEKFINWVQFENHQDEILVDLDSHESRTIVMNIFAGQTGTYKLILIAHSETSQSLTTISEQSIQITHHEKGIFTNSPDIQWLAVPVIAFLAIVIAFRRTKKRHKNSKRDKSG